MKEKNISMDKKTKLDQRRCIFYKSPFSLLVSSDENNILKCGEDFPTHYVKYCSI